LRPLLDAAASRPRPQSRSSSSSSPMSSSDTADARAASSRVPASCRAARRPQTRALSRYCSVTGAAPRTCAGRLVSPLGDTRPAVFRARPRPSMHHQRASPLAHTHACREVSGRAGGEGREACAPAGRPAASAQRAAHPCAPPRPAAPPPGGRRCAARAAGTARPPRRPPGPPAGSRRPAPRAPRGVARHGAGGDIGHHAEVSLLCP